MYIDKADFRDGTLQWYTSDLALTPAQATDAALTAAITAMSERFDLLTGDHFEAEPGGSPEGTTTIVIDGGGGSFVEVPKRIRSITKVEIQDEYGNWLEQATDIYRVVPSLVSGARTEDDIDAVYVTPGRYVSGGGWPAGTLGSTTWPKGVQTLRLTGKFSWATTPERVKRAVALMVWDHFATVTPDIRRAGQWSTQDGQFIRSDSKPTGIPEVDEIIDDYSRFKVPAV